MPRDLEALLLTLLRSRELRTRMGPLIQALLLARLLAGAQHDGPPHRAQRPSRRALAARSRRARRESLAGRRPRG
ncbi:MAG TPA: hypothetical protein VF533_07040 [Solirubrobacteraceae bacterium]|jgi:hypothetical protein